MEHLVRLVAGERYAVRIVRGRPGASGRAQAEVVAVRVCGNWAMSRGRYRLDLILPTVPQPIAITGKNVHTYLRQPDGSWLIASDIWNTDAPVRRGPPQQQ